MWDSPWQRACPLTRLGAVLHCLGLLSEWALPALLARAFHDPDYVQDPLLGDSELNEPCPCAKESTA